MLKTRFALAASVATLALAGCGAAASSNTTSSVTGGTDTSATTPATASAGGTTPGGGRMQLQEVTGTAATKASSAALAKYPGTVERVLKTPTGYAVHVMTSGGGEKHVAVSSAFKVTGLEQMPAGGPPSGGAPNGAVQPKGAAPTATTPTGTASS